MPIQLPSPGTVKEVPLDIVGSNGFGQDDKISIEQTFNMYISDNWFVGFPGFRTVISLGSTSAEGRGNYPSSKNKRNFFVINNNIYVSNTTFGVAQIGTLDTFSGNVYIAENDTNQIAFCDQLHIYIYNYITNIFQKITTDFTPQYIAFQDGYFLSCDLNNPEWRLSQQGDGTIWPADATSEGAFQTKPDVPVAIVPFPGKGGMLLILGSICGETWFNTAYQNPSQLFPYTRSTSFNVDYGTVNAATVCWNDNLVAWIGVNKKSSPVIMYTQGGDPQQVSDDGLNKKLATIPNPGNSYASMITLSGHLFYIVTFVDANLTYAYDFTNQKFFTLTDHNQDAFLAKQIAFFNDSYYFVSPESGNLYQYSQDITDFDGEIIPRIRICQNIRGPKQGWFICNNVTFTIKQGYTDDVQKVMLSLSKDGGASFGDIETRELNTLGARQNRLNFWNLGMANDLVLQFRFVGMDKFICTDGLVSIYQ